MQCTAHNRHGNQCGKHATPGTNVCSTHSSAAPQVKAAAQRRLLEAADPAAAKLVELLDSDNERVALAAARDLLDRAGLGTPAEVEGELTLEVVQAALARKRAQLEFIEGGGD